MGDLCPVCDNDLSLDLVFVSKDYAMVFEVECPQCNTKLEVEVETIPYFNVKEKDKDATAKA